jgi:hypothetical protein
MTNTQFRIILMPGSSYQNDFETSPNPIWQAAWTDRVQPHLKEHDGFLIQDLVDLLTMDGVSAWYTNYFVAM